MRFYIEIIRDNGMVENIYESTEYLDAAEKQRKIILKIKKKTKGYQDINSCYIKIKE